MKRHGILNWGNNIYVAVIIGYIITRDTGIVMDKETIRCWIINAGITLVIGYAAYSGVILYEMLVHGLSRASARLFAARHRVISRQREMRQSREAAD